MNELPQQLLQRWAEAERDGDVDALAPMLTDDFQFVGPLGFTLDKKQWLERYTSGSLVHGAFTWETGTVRHFGPVAVAIGVQNQRTQYQGHPVDGRFRGTQILVDDGGWKLAGLQLSPMAEGA
jgi:ketosteroid isomerase-like protein